jgi:hypothetical protein
MTHRSVRCAGQAVARPAREPAGATGGLFRRCKATAMPWKGIRRSYGRHELAVPPQTGGGRCCRRRKPPALPRAKAEYSCSRRSTVIRRGAGVEGACRCRSRPLMVGAGTGHSCPCRREMIEPAAGATGSVVSCHGALPPPPRRVSSPLRRAPPIASVQAGCPQYPTSACGHARSSASCGRARSDAPAEPSRKPPPSPQRAG